MEGETKAGMGGGGKFCSSIFRGHGGLCAGTWVGGWVGGSFSSQCSSLKRGIGEGEVGGGEESLSLEPDPAGM